MDCKRTWVKAEEVLPDGMRRLLPPPPPEMRLILTGQAELPVDPSDVAAFNAAMAAHWEASSLLRCAVCKGCFRPSTYMKLHHSACVLSTSASDDTTISMGSHCQAVLTPPITREVGRPVVVPALPLSESGAKQSTRQSQQPHAHKAAHGGKSTKAAQVGSDGSPRAMRRGFFAGTKPGRRVLPCPPGTALTCLPFLLLQAENNAVKSTLMQAAAALQAASEGRAGKPPPTIAARDLQASKGRKKSAAATPVAASRASSALGRPISTNSSPACGAEAKTRAIGDSEAGKAKSSSRARDRAGGQAGKAECKASAAKPSKPISSRPSQSALATPVKAQGAPVQKPGYAKSPGQATRAATGLEATPTKDQDSTCQHMDRAAPACQLNTWSTVSSLHSGHALQSSHMYSCYLCGQHYHYHRSAVPRPQPSNARLCRLPLRLLCPPVLQLLHAHRAVHSEMGKGASFCSEPGRARISPAGPEHAVRARPSADR